MYIMKTLVKNYPLEENFIKKMYYNGKFTFCYDACLSMALKFTGINLTIPYLENITTMPYGFLYSTHEDKFELCIGGMPPHLALKFAIQTLGFKVTQKSFKTFEKASSYMDTIIQEKPIIIGPVNIGTMPNHLFEHIPPGADHYILALRKFESSGYIIHDPEGFIGIPITDDELADFWKGDDIGYTDSNYILTYLNEKINNPNEEEIFKSVLKQGVENLETNVYSPYFMTGVGSIKKFLDDVEGGKYPNFDNILDGFQLEMNNQRCYASAQFLEEHIKFHPLLKQASEIRYN